MMKQLRGRNLAHPGCLVGLTLGLIIGIVLAGILAQTTHLSFTTIILSWAAITLVLAIIGWIVGASLTSKFPPAEDEVESDDALPDTHSDSSRS